MRMKKPVKHVPEPEPVDQVEDMYDQAMADVYDILMEAYDRVGVRMKELVEEIQYMEDTIEVELEDDESDQYGD